MYNTTVILALEKDRVIVSFGYNSILVNIIKTVQGRRFNPLEKVWSVPISSLTELLNTLDRLYVPYEMDSDLRTLLGVPALRRVFYCLPTLGKPDYEFILPPFEHQISAINKLSSDLSTRTGFFYDTGTGKSLVVLVLFDLFLKRGALDKLIIVCPKPVKKQWFSKKGERGEINLHTPHLRVQEIKDKIDPEHDIFLLSYDSVGKHLGSLIKMCKTYRVMLVADECTRVKNRQAQRTKALMSLSKAATRFIPVTGTPMKNKPESMWTILYMIDPIATGSWSYFIDKYCIKEPRFNSIVGYRNLDQLAILVESLSIRKRLEDCVDLPPVVTENLEVEMVGHQKEMYKAMRDEFRILLSSKTQEAIYMESDCILAKMTRLRQISSHPALLIKRGEHPSKLKLLVELVEDIVEAGEKVIICTTFVETNNIICSLLDRYGAVPLHGRLSEGQVERNYRAFQSERETRIMVMHPKTGGYGFDMTVSNRIINYDYDFDFEAGFQSLRRTQRITQTKKCSIINLICSPIDKYCLEINNYKQELSDKVIDRRTMLDKSKLMELLG